MYEAQRLSEAPPEQFRAFVLRCFGARDEEQDAGIHGYKGAIPVWVGESDQRNAATASDVQAFANAIRQTLRYKQDNLRDGFMLAWAFRPDAVEAVERLRRQRRIPQRFHPTRHLHAVPAALGGLRATRVEGAEVPAHENRAVVEVADPASGPATVCFPYQPRHVRATVTANDTGRNNSEAPQCRSIPPHIDCGSGRATTRLSASSASDFTPAVRAVSSFRCGTNKYRHCPYFVQLIFSHHRRAASLLSAVFGRISPLVSASHITSRPSALRAAMMKSGKYCRRGVEPVS